MSNIPWWLCGHASILPSSPPPCKPATLSFLLSIQAVTPRQLHSEQLNLHDRSEKLSTSRVQDPLRTPRPPPIQTDTRLIAPPAKRDILYRAAELLYKLSLKKKKKKYWGSLDHKPDTFFSSSSCCGRFTEWNNTAFTFTPASMNTFIVLTALLNSSYTPVRLTARPSSLSGFNMIKDFKHYHEVFVLDRCLHFLLKNGNDMGREILRSVEVFFWYCAVSK